MKSSAPEVANISFMRASPYSQENVRKGIVHYLFGRGMSAVAGFFAIILLVRHMDVAGYAAYTAMLGVTMFAGMLASLGMERALARYIPEGMMHHSSSDLARLIWVASLIRFSVMLLLIAVLILVWPAAAGRFAGLEIAPDFPLALAALLINATMFQQFSTVMQALVQQKTLTRVLVVQWAGRLILILLLISNYSEVTLNQALWLMALPDGIGMLILMGVIYHYLKSLDNAAGHADRGHPGWPAWAQVRRLAMDNYGYNLLAALPQSSSMIILAAAFLSAPFVAAYGFYINLLDRLKQYLPLQFMLNLAEPVLIAGFMKDKDFNLLCHHGRLLYKFNLLLIMPALAWIAAIAPSFTVLITGGKYAEYAWVFPVLILQIALGSHATIIQIIINAVGKSTILTCSGLSALAAMGLSILAVMASGHLIYLVVAPLAYEIVNNLIAVFLLNKQGFHYDAQPGFHWKLAAAVIAAYLCSTFASGAIEMPLGKVMIAGVVSVAVFGLTIVLLRTVEHRDLETLKELLKRKRVQKPHS